MQQQKKKKKKKKKKIKKKEKKKIKWKKKKKKKKRKKFHSINVKHELNSTNNDEENINIGFFSNIMINITRNI